MSIETDISNSVLDLVTTHLKRYGRPAEEPYYFLDSVLDSNNGVVRLKQGFKSNTTAIVLNRGDFQAGDSVLVIRTLGDELWVYAPPRFDLAILPTVGEEVPYVEEALVYWGDRVVLNAGPPGGIVTHYASMYITDEVVSLGSPPVLYDNCYVTPGESWVSWGVLVYYAPDGSVQWVISAVGIAEEDVPEGWVLVGRRGKESTPRRTALDIQDGLQLTHSYQLDYDYNEPPPPNDYGNSFFVTWGRQKFEVGEEYLIKMTYSHPPELGTVSLVRARNTTRNIDLPFVHLPTSSVSGELWVRIKVEPLP